MPHVFSFKFEVEDIWAGGFYVFNKNGGCGSQRSGKHRVFFFPVGLGFPAVGAGVGSLRVASPTEVAMHAGMGIADVEETAIGF